MLFPNHNNCQCHPYQCPIHCRTIAANRNPHWSPDLDPDHHLHVSTFSFGICVNVYQRRAQYKIFWLTLNTITYLYIQKRKNIKDNTIRITNTQFFFMWMLSTGDTINCCLSCFDSKIYEFNNYWYVYMVPWFACVLFFLFVGSNHCTTIKCLCVHHWFMDAINADAVETYESSLCYLSICNLFVCFFFYLKSCVCRTQWIHIPMTQINASWCPSIRNKK